MTTTRTPHGKFGHVFHEADGTFRAISTLRDMGGKFDKLADALAWLDLIHG